MTFHVRPEDMQLSQIQRRPSNAEIPDELLRGMVHQILHDADPFVEVVDIPAGVTAPPHSHTVAEVHIVLSGCLEYGGMAHPAGSILMMSAGEEYSIHMPVDTRLVVIREREGVFNLHE